ncbi:MAG: site-specific integrase [Thaumarchaeota archaeon]|nr:site-specific integrase [Nitrososphaerota archaeon]
MQRALLRFENAVKSDATREQYNYSLNRFLKYAKIPRAEELLQLKDDFLQRLLEDYLFHLKKRVGPNSIPPHFAALELFLAINDKNLNFKKIRKMFPARLKKTGGKAYTTAQVRQMLEVTTNHRGKAIIHLFASTGCRVGAIPSLHLKHMQEIEDCKAVTFYEGEAEEYVGFLTPEASRVVDAYLEKRKRDGEIMTRESPLIRRSYQFGASKARPVSKEAIQAFVAQVLRKAGIERARQGNRYEIQLDHGFRKRFNTIIKNNNGGSIHLKEKLMAHSTRLLPLDGAYHDPGVMALFDEFKRHIPNLIIDDAERSRLEVAAKAKRISELEAEMKVHESMVRWFRRYRDAHPEEFKEIESQS